MEQAIQKKKYEVLVADEEAKRKISEANGIAEANRIIANSLSDNYLRWYWTEQVGSKNPTTIYVPSEGGFPVLTKDA
jgi:hypothetical protein